MLVQNPAAPEWGLGQVQSNINGKITINFEHIGKTTLVGDAVSLERIFGKNGY